MTRPTSKARVFDPALRLARQAVRRRKGTELDGWVISFPKSGRTWLMFLYVYYGAYRLLGDDADEFIDEVLPFTFRLSKSEQFRALLAAKDDGSSVPVLGFSHALPPRTPYYALDLDLPQSAWTGSRVLLLARDPRDVVVSFFYHTSNRGIRGTRALRPSGERAKNRRLPEDADLGEFVRSESLGARAVVEYLNRAVALAESRGTPFETLYYEDMLADTSGELERFLGFFGVTSVDRAAVARAVERSSLQNLQARERTRRARRKKDPEDTTGFRFRRGERGSHLDELGPEDIAYLDRVIDLHLHPRFARYWPSKPGTASAEVGLAQDGSTT